jgi:hypothetical protein
MSARTKHEPMMNSTAVANFCRVTKEQVLRWARRGLVPSYRIAGTQKRLFKARDLAKMIRPVEPTKEAPAVPIQARLKARFSA